MSAAEVGSTMTPVEPHQTHRSFVNSHETAPNARQTPDDPNRAAQGGGSTSGLATRPASRAQAPHSTPTPRQLFYMPATSAPDDPPQTRDAGPRRTTQTRDISLSSAAQLRAPPRLPHLTFSSSDEKWRTPPARAASRSTKDRESRSALLAPPSTGRATWRLNRGRRGRDLESKSLTCNVRRCTVAFAESVTFWRFYHATSP